MKALDDLGSIPIINDLAKQASHKTVLAMKHAMDMAAEVSTHPLSLHTFIIKIVMTCANTTHFSVAALVCHDYDEWGGNAPEQAMRKVAEVVTEDDLIFAGFVLAFTGAHEEGGQHPIRLAHDAYKAFRGVPYTRGKGHFDYDAVMEMTA